MLHTSRTWRLSSLRQIFAYSWRGYTSCVLDASSALGTVLCRRLVGAGHKVKAVVNHIDNARDLDDLLSLQARECSTSSASSASSSSSLLDIYEVNPHHAMSYQTLIADCDYIIRAATPMFEGGGEEEDEYVKKNYNLFQSIHASKTAKMLILCHNLSSVDLVEAKKRKLNFLRLSTAAPATAAEAAAVRLCHSMTLAATTWIDASKSTSSTSRRVRIEAAVSVKGLNRVWAMPLDTQGSAELLMWYKNLLNDLPETSSRSANLDLEEDELATTCLHLITCEP